MRFAFPKTACNLVSVFIGLAACGGAGSSVTDDPLFLGAVADSASGNGLPFAEPGTLFPFNAAIEVPVVTVDVDATRQSGDPQVMRAAVTPDVPFFLGGDPTFDILLNGETVSLTDGVGVFEDGTGIEALRLASQSGAYLVGFAVADEGAFETLSMFGFGRETPPSVVSAATGTATLDGPLRFMIAAYEDNDFTGATGGIQGVASFTIDFDDGALSGTAQSEALIDGEGRLLGDFAEARIVGNSAVGEVTWSCDNGATCADTADYGLVFLGNDATTAVGLTSIDTDLVVGDQNLAIVGASGFILDDAEIAE